MSEPLALATDGFLGGGGDPIALWSLGLLQLPEVVVPALPGSWRAEISVFPAHATATWATPRSRGSWSSGSVCLTASTPRARTCLAERLTAACVSEASAEGGLDPARASAVVQKHGASIIPASSRAGGGARSGSATGSPAAPEPITEIEE